MRWWSGAIACGFVVASTSEAAAREVAQLRFSGVEGDGCPDEPALRRMVAAQLGYDPFAASAPMRIEAVIERKANRLRGRIMILRDGRLAGERELDANNDCEALASALALTISVAIDPMGASRDPHTAQPLPAPALRAEEAQPTATPKRESREPSSSDARAVADRAAEKPPGAASPSLRLALAPAVSVGTAPAVAFGGAASVGVRWARALLLARGAVRPPGLGATLRRRSGQYVHRDRDVRSMHSRGPLGRLCTRESRVDAW